MLRTVVLILVAGWNGVVWESTGTLSLSRISFFGLVKGKGQRGEGLSEPP